MNKRPSFLLTILFVVFILLLAGGCKTISVFDQYAYTMGTALKVDALNLMDSAVVNYASQQTHITDVTTRIEKAYEYEKHRSQNGITVKMWELLKNPDRNLFGGFIKRWKEKQALSATFVNEAKVQVGQAFDLIVELESQKIKPDDKSVSTFISTN